LDCRDFGLAKAERVKAASASDETVTQTITQEGTILGTLQYMAPEQLQGKPVDARSDLFSFGCVLYEMLTGKRAFEGESAPSVIAAVLEREPAPLEISPSLERVVRRALAKDPEQRFQTAREVKTALDSFRTTLLSGSPIRTAKRRMSPSKRGRLCTLTRWSIYRKTQAIRRLR
jgi:serine/threonine protein kinase